MSKKSRDYEERMLTLMKQLPPVGLKESAEHKVFGFSNNLKTKTIKLFLLTTTGNRKRSYGAFKNTTRRT